MTSTALNAMGLRPDMMSYQLAYEQRDRLRAAYHRATLMNKVWQGHSNGCFQQA
jgi:hypothetical protein